MCCFRGQKVFIKFNGKLNAGLFNSYKYSIFNCVGCELWSKRTKCSARLRIERCSLILTLSMLKRFSFVFFFSVIENVVTSRAAEILAWY